MQQQIKQVFSREGGIPLYYAESGSRLWGIQSPDSDYDVRGFHLPTRRQYYDYRRRRDLIEIMDGEFDFVSYTLDKMFTLLAKSNPTVFEWMRSDIIYLNQLPQWTQFREQTMQYIDFRALFHHYISLANGNIHLMDAGKRFTYKTVFYCIRGLLSANLAAQRIIPELEISRLFAQCDPNIELIDIARDSMERKRQQTEKEPVPEPIREPILSAVRRFTAQLAPMEPAAGSNRTKLEDILTEYSLFVKTLHYNEPSCAGF